jgi:hypothetical protein
VHIGRRHEEAGIEVSVGTSHMVAFDRHIDVVRDKALGRRRLIRLIAAVSV